jgi:hypothetical protein
VEERWAVRDTGPVTSEVIGDFLRGRIAAGEMTTWLESSIGRTVGLVANGARAMLVLMEHEGDAGFHAVDLNAASDARGGYVLENGQVDTYPDRDTVPIEDAVEAVAVLVESGELDDRINWHCDR